PRAPTATARSRSYLHLQAGTKRCVYETTYARRTRMTYFSLPPLKKDLQIDWAEPNVAQTTSPFWLRRSTCGRERPLASRRAKRPATSDDSESDEREAECRGDCVRPAADR